MGQKIHPYGFRLGITTDWKSRWFSGKSSFANNLIEDFKIRKFLVDKFSTAGLKDVQIDRNLNEISITVRVSKPGIVIGRGGTGIEEVEKQLKKLTASKIKITAVEVKVPEVEAQLIADYIARQLKRRMPYRRVAKGAVRSAMDKGAKGIKIKLSGLLSGGNTISRVENFSEGSIPAQTLRADIDYAQLHCQMLYGTVGIKVWVYKGELEL
ncbi:MAG: 30S ribosomal protein S3 [Patescibacteria group bacterium]|jgi:small subunit ribosomal protein S3